MSESVSLKKPGHELRQLKEENARLKKIVAELSLDKSILQDVATKKWGGPRFSSACAVATCSIALEWA